jgi:hypothetical protein
MNESTRLCNIAKTQPRTFWKTLKKCYKPNNKNTNQPQINEMFNHFNDLIGNDPSDSIDNEINEHNLNTPQTVIEQLDSPITESEIYQAVFKQNNGKSSGPDDISAEIIKTAYNSIKPYLTTIFNTIFDTAQYPESWGVGYITPIFKSGDPSDAKNYRGITLNNILSKIYSQVLLNRMTKWCDENKIISDCQFGYQKGKSTVDCIFILNSIINKVLNSGQKLYCIFIDYAKCYDSINRSLLWQKLITEQISTKMISALKAMYSSVKSAVRLNNEISEYINSYSGVKQGDPCSSILFMMFVNDIIENINSNIEGIISIDDIKFFLLSYADDQVLFSTSPTSAQLMLNDIENYCNTYKLKINISKTKVVIFEKSNRQTSFNFTLYGEPLEIVASFKYLGVTLFKNGNWYKTIKSISEHGNRALHRLFSVVNQYEFPTKEKLNLFDKLVTPVLHYSAEIWGHDSGKELEIIHTKFLRKILCVNKSTNLSALYGELGRYPLSVIRKLHIFKYWFKLISCTNDNLIKITYSFMFNDAEQNITYNNRNWAYQIKSILEQLGLTYVWNEQETLTEKSEQTYTYNLIKQRLFDHYKQHWYSEIINSSRLNTYCRTKNTFNTEPYLDIITTKKFKIALTQFRLSSHRLEIERGRYHNIARDNRKCKFCNLNVVESEYHFLLICPLYKDIRKTYLKSYYQAWPTLNKFDMLMGTQNKKEIINLSKYIYNANCLRNNLETH